MNFPARVPFALGMMAASVLAFGCQSILGITDRPLDAGPDDDANLPQDSGGATVDGSDGGGGAIDGSEGGATDATRDSPSYSIHNPLRVDVSSLFNANTVVTSTPGGAALNPMDGLGSSANSDFATQNYIDAFFGAGNGLPDEGQFTGDGTTIPNTVQLAWSDKNTPKQNSMLVSGTSKAPYTVTVPPGQYTQVQIYATTTGPNTTLSYTLAYSDTFTSTGVINLSDWCVPVSPLPGGQYVLGKGYRVQNGMSGTDAGTLNRDYNCNIYALNLNPDPTKALIAFTLNYSGNTTSYFILYGATAW